MKAFVTAGTGFLGGALCAELARRNHQITALVSPPAKAQSLAAVDVRMVAGDILKPKTYRDEVPRADVAIHCAQLTPQKRKSTGAVRCLQPVFSREGLLPRYAKLPTHVRVV